VHNGGLKAQVFQLGNDRVPTLNRAGTWSYLARRHHHATQRGVAVEGPLALERLAVVEELCCALHTVRLVEDELNAALATGAALEARKDLVPAAAVAMKARGLCLIGGV
jgi:hypothetical protein